MGQEPRHVAAMPEEMDVVVGRHQIAESLQLRAVGAVADDQQMDVLAKDAEQIQSPNGVLDAFLMRKPANHSDQESWIGKS